MRPFQHALPLSARSAGATLASKIPTVSVVIPTFNRGHLVTNAIESVLNQTFAAHEIIVVDDGSTDDTSDKLKPYEHRIQYFYQDNRGVSAAQNKGIELARGEWIAILASDDLWLPSKLERQVMAVAELGPQFGACFTDCGFFGNSLESASAFERANFASASKVGPLRHPFECILARHAAIYVQSLLVRRSLLAALEGFDERMVVAEDTDLIFRLAFLTELCFVNEVLVGIDRTGSRNVGLTELYAQQDDKAFRSRERMFKKWLGLPALIDPALRQEIRVSLNAMYDDWVVAKLHQSKWKEALGVARRQRESGGRYTSLLARLVLRAARKVSSTTTAPHHRPGGGG